MSDLQDLQQAARRLHRAATSKASRLRVNQGVEIGGTEFDKRRDLNVVAGYNKRQLNSYIKSLKGFTDRSNSFVSGQGGQPLPAAMVKKFQAAQAKYNAIGVARFEKVADIVLPTTNLTIREREKGLLPAIRRAAGEVTNRPYSPNTLKASDINGADALKVLLKDMTHKTSRAYSREKSIEGRAQLQYMLDVINDNELQQRIDRLSNKEFDTLWNYTDFGKQLLPDYSRAKLQASETSLDDVQQNIDQDAQVIDAHRLIDKISGRTADDDNAYWENLANTGRTNKHHEWVKNSVYAVKTTRGSKKRSR